MRPHLSADSTKAAGRVAHAALALALCAGLAACGSSGPKAPTPDDTEVPDELKPASEVLGKVIQSFKELGAAVGKVISFHRTYRFSESGPLSVLRTKICYLSIPSVRILTREMLTS